MATRETAATNVGGFKAKRISTPPLAKGELFASRYRILALLGRGGFGEVYRVQEVVSKRIFALKLHRGVSNSTVRAEAIRDEFSVLTRLRHRYLARVYDFGFSGDDIAFFTQELIEGDCLHPNLCKWSGREGVRIIEQLCVALDYLHMRDILHRDIKPANAMFVRKEARVALLDFGIALTRSSLESANTAGTPAYMAPEAFVGGTLDVRADLYSLGATLYELLSGKRPHDGFVGQTLWTAKLYYPAEPLPRSLPLSLRELIASMLSPSADKRPSSAIEVFDAYAAACRTKTSLRSAHRHVEALNALALPQVLVEQVESLEAHILGTTKGALCLHGESDVCDALLRELRRSAQFARLPWLHFRGGHSDESRSLLVELVRELWLTHASFLKEDERRTLARSVPDLRRAGERLAFEVDQERTRHEQLEIALRWLETCAPTSVLCIEDCESLNPQDCLLLQRIGARVQAQTTLIKLVLLIGTKVDTDTLPIAAATLRVVRCGHESGREAVAAIVGQASDEVLDAFSTHSTPLDAVALALEEGVLVRDGVRFQLVNHRPISDAAGERVKRLPQDARQLLLCAALLGRSLAKRDLSELHAGSRTHAELLLNTLTAGHFVVVEDDGDQHQYRAEPRYRDALYTTVDEDMRSLALRACAAMLLRKRNLHWPEFARAAEYLKLAHDPDDAERWLRAAEIDAESAGRPDLAATFAVRVSELGNSGKSDALLRANDYAARAGDTALEEHSLLLLTQTLGEQKSSLWTRRARFSIRRGAAAQAESEAKEALTLAQNQEERAAAKRALARVKVAHGNAHDALLLYRESAQEGREVQGRIESLLGRALAALRFGDGRDTLTAAEEAAALARAENDPSALSEALRHLGNAQRELGQARVARATYARAVRAAREAGNLEAEAKALNNLGSTAHMLGEIEQALDAWNRSIAIKERIGATSSAMLTHASLGGVLTVLGRYDDARRSLERVVSASAAVGDIARPLALSNLGDLMVTRGALEEAQRLYEEANRLYRDHGWSQLLTHGLVGQIRCLLFLRGNDARAQVDVALTELGQLHESLHTEEATRRFQLSAAVVARARGDHQSALDLSTLVLRAAAKRSANSFADVFATSIEAAWIVALSRAALGDAKIASQLGQRTRTRLLSLANQLPAEMRTMFLDGHPLHRAIMAQNFATDHRGLWSMDDFRPSVRVPRKRSHNPPPRSTTDM